MFIREVEVISRDVVMSHPENSSWEIIPLSCRIPGLIQRPLVIISDANYFAALYTLWRARKGVE
jgi:hypothetical protein